jgi:hypothetical protein
MGISITKSDVLFTKTSLNQGGQFLMEVLKNVNNCLNTNIYSNLKTSGACVIKLITAVIYLDPMVKP